MLEDVLEVTANFAFGNFVLDEGDRRLVADDKPIDLNGRYFDALALLVRERGRLVSKDRFMSEVWRGVPVTDEALTQCVRTLRRQLGDDASRPRFIETVPKHGYRFIAPVEIVERDLSAASAGRSNASQWTTSTGTAGTVGGALAGLIGGVIYGFAAASQSSVGAISVMLVLLTVMTAIGAIGAAGVSYGIATATWIRDRSWQWLTIGGAVGGLLVGALGKLLGHDSLLLLVGRSPGAITGAMEGCILGAAVGFAAYFAQGSRSPGRGFGIGAASGAVAGLVIAGAGGRLMLGSLALLAANFPGSRLRLGQIEAMFGEAGFGPATQYVSSALEAALFSGCVVAAMTIAGRRRG